MAKQNNNNKKLSRTTKTLLAASGIAAVGSAAFFSLGAYIYQNTLTHKAVTGKWNLESRLEDARLNPELDDHFLAAFAEGVYWFRSQEIHKVITIAQRSERLHADCIFTNNISSSTAKTPWVIAMHGYANQPENLGMYAKTFQDWGYNFLAPYLCGHYESEADFVSMGWIDRLDILSWIDFLNREYDHPPIILFGESMGAAAVMMATGENLPANVVCAIEDSGYTSVKDIMSVQMRQAVDMNASLLLSAISSITALHAGFNVKEASCITQVAKSHTPTLFIHGDRDDESPFWMLSVLYEACASEKEMLIVPGAAHVQGSRQDPALYWGTVKAFIDKHLQA